MIERIDDLVAYLSSFHASWMPSPGLPSSAIPDDLPGPLARLYLEFGSLIARHDSSAGGRQGGRGPFGWQDTLSSVHDLKRFGEMIEFAWENQGNWSCRCAVGAGDPAVFSNAALYWDKPREGFQKVCDSLEHFLITLSLQEAVMSAPWLVQPEVESLELVFAAALEPLWLRGRYVFEGPSHDFYLLRGQDVLVMDHAGLWIASHSEIRKEFFRHDVQMHRIP
jgi:hypothetical protein